ncbi:hypothetical protein V3C99_002792 [Haemonchus contortus]
MPLDLQRLLGSKSFLRKGRCRNVWRKKVLVVEYIITIIQPSREHLYGSAPTKATKWLSSTTDGRPVRSLSSKLSSPLRNFSMIELKHWKFLIPLLFYSSSAP